MKRGIASGLGPAARAGIEKPDLPMLSSSALAGFDLSAMNDPPT
ncbi:MAG: hypothetical protein ABJZ56_05760 [Paracoccaceae bacterium]